MITYEDLGQAGIQGQISTITSAKGFSSLLVTPKPLVKYYVPFTSGGTYEITAGDKITGATSSSTALVEGVILESGTWAGADAAGILLLSNRSAAFQSENLDVGANLNEATIVQDLIDFVGKGLPAKTALITIETAAIRFTESGINPTATAGTGFGHLMAVAQSYVIRGLANIKRFLCINAVNASGSVVKYTIYY